MRREAYGDTTNPTTRELDMNVITTTPQQAWAEREQNKTLITAHAWGERWTRDDLELVAEFTDAVRDADLALVLGRSLYAIWSVQVRLRELGLEGLLAVTRDRTPASSVRPLSSRTYTFVGDDVPPGWND